MCDVTDSQGVITQLSFENESEGIRKLLCMCNVGLVFRKIFTMSGICVHQKAFSQIMNNSRNTQQVVCTKR